MQIFMFWLKVSAHSFFIASIIVLFATVDVMHARDIITGAGDGSTHVRRFDGQSQSIKASFFAFPPSFTGGVRVAAGDVNGDGTADIVTGAGPGAGPHVKVFEGQTSAELDSFLAYNPVFAGGVYVASGDINGDTVYDIVTGAGGGGGGHVKVFDGATGSEVKSFFAFAGGAAAEVRVAAGDVNGDGYADIIAGRSDLSRKSVRRQQRHQQRAHEFQRLSRAYWRRSRCIGRY
jgi:hypothetical protein